MWQQSGSLLCCSCHGIAGFLVDEMQIWVWRHFLEVLPDMTLIFIFPKKYIIFIRYVNRFFYGPFILRCHFKENSRMTFQTEIDKKFCDTCQI